MRRIIHSLCDRIIHALGGYTYGEYIALEAQLHGAEMLIETYRIIIHGGNIDDD